MIFTGFAQIIAYRVVDLSPEAGATSLQRQAEGVILGKPEGRAGSGSRAGDKGRLAAIEKCGRSSLHADLSRAALKIEDSRPPEHKTQRNRGNRQSAARRPLRTAAPPAVRISSGRVGLIKLREREQDASARGC